MKFTYIGEAPNGFIELYGARFVPGEAVEVTDAMAMRKLGNHSLFVASSEPTAPAEPEPKRKPRKPRDEPVNGDVPEV